MGFPGQLDSAIAQWLEGRRQGLAARSAALTAAYRKGQTSGGIDLAAYLTVRLPATFAVNARVMDEVARLRPAFAPATLLDVGAGPGTAGWAALRTWPGIAAVEQVEATPAFAAVLQELNAGSGIAALERATLCDGSLVQWQGKPHDLVAASYVLAELPVGAIADAVIRLWAATAQLLVLIEPGTPDGFKRIHAARQALLGLGAVIVAPCTHHAGCPMSSGNWCHFKERVQRSRAHMHAKGATVPFEDEPYSYLVAARDGDVAGGARVMAPPEVSKTGVGLTLCSADGLSDAVVPARDKAAYKRAKKMGWGDASG